MTITSTSNETVLSQDGKTVYVAGKDGNLSAYDLDSGAKLSAWAVGKQLGGMSLTTDGRHAVVTERTPTSSVVDQYGRTSYTFGVYSVNLTNGETHVYTYSPSYSYDYAFYDAAVLSNGKVLLTGSFQGSGWVTPQTLDLTTGTFTALGGSYRQDSILSSSQGGAKILLAESNISNAPVSLLTVGTSGLTKTASNDSSGFNRGVQAISANGQISANYIYGTGVLIFDSALKFTINLTNNFPEWRSTSGLQGLAFSPDGTTLYVVDGDKDRIVSLSTTDWSIRNSYDAGVTLKNTNMLGMYGNNLLTSADGEYLILTHAGGVTRIDTAIVNGTTAAETMTGSTGIDKLYGLEGNDQLFGMAGDDQLFGGSGDDVLNGGAGNDLLDGGAGLDRATYAHVFQTYGASASGGTITLRGAADEGTDTLTSVESISFKDGVLVSDTDAVGSQVIRLYDAVFGRAPDAAGLEYWRDQIADKGVSLNAVAGALIASAEFQAATGNLSNAAFVEYVYQHTLGRASDQGGRSYWTEQLAQGMSRGDLLVNFSESAEHRTATASLVAQGHFITDAAYKAVALLYDSAIDRLPDQDGLVFWADQVKAGTLSIGQVAQGFAASAEFTARTNGMDHGQLVDFMYRTTLDRGADAGGRTYWVDQLDHGLDTGGLLAAFSQSAEHAALFAPHLINGIDIIV